MGHGSRVKLAAEIAVIVVAFAIVPISLYSWLRPGGPRYEHKMWMCCTRCGDLVAFSPKTTGPWDCPKCGGRCALGLAMVCRDCGVLYGNVNLGPEAEFTPSVCPRCGGDRSELYDPRVHDNPPVYVPRRAPEPDGRHP